MEKGAGSSRLEPTARLGDQNSAKEFTTDYTD